MTRLPAGENGRESVEDLLATLSNTDKCLRLIETRARLILERQADLSRLVTPIFREVDQLRVDISTIRGIISAEWQAGERAHWSH